MMMLCPAASPRMKTIECGWNPTVVTNSLCYNTTMSSTPDEIKVPQRIVCAANRHVESGRIVLGLRHYDSFMHAQIADITPEWKGKVEQGFVDQFGKFLTRKEAWVVASTQNQIVRRVGGDTKDGGTLWSENLY